MVKNLPDDIGDTGSISGLGTSPGGRNATHSVCEAWKSHGKRSLMGYSPWGCQELTITEPARTYTHTHTHTTHAQHIPDEHRCKNS